MELPKVGRLLALNRGNLIAGKPVLALYVREGRDYGLGLGRRCGAWGLVARRWPRQGVAEGKGYV
jgi:hypothetical protein